MEYRDVPHLLREMYEEALQGSEAEENERYRLALLGLANAFRADLERIGIQTTNLVARERKAVNSN